MVKARRGWGREEGSEERADSGRTGIRKQKRRMKKERKRKDDVLKERENRVKNTERQ